MINLLNSPGPVVKDHRYGRREVQHRTFEEGDYKERRSG